MCDLVVYFRHRDKLLLHLLALQFLEQCVFLRNLELCFLGGLAGVGVLFGKSVEINLYRVFYAAAHVCPGIGQCLNDPRPVYPEIQGRLSNAKECFGWH